MTREIKFRAWSSKNKEMIYFGSPEVLCDESEGLLFYRKNMALSVEMKRPKLMQFTGLHDKNGKEIYEGDVVEYEGYDAKDGSWRDKWVVQFVNDLSSYYLMPTNGDTKPDLLHEIGNDMLEIIGNIYENPELLKV